MQRKKTKWLQMTSQDREEEFQKLAMARGFDYVRAEEISMETEDEIQALLRGGKPLSDALVKKIFSDNSNDAWRKIYSHRKNGQKRKTVPFDSGLPGGEDQSELLVKYQSWLRKLACMLHVLQFGEHPERGESRLMAGDREVSTEVVKRTYELLLLAVRTAPVDPSTRTAAQKRLKELLDRASHNTRVLFEDTPPDIEIGGLEIEDGVRGKLCTLHVDAVALLRLLYERLDDAILINHVQEQFEELDGEKLSSSPYWFNFRYASRDRWAPWTILTQLHRLWRDAEGILSCMTITSGDALGSGFRVFACDRRLALVPPVPDTPFSPAQEDRLRRRGYRPCEVEGAPWRCQRKANNKEDLKRIEAKLDQTLREVFGLDMDEEGVDALTEHGVEEQDIMATPTKLPTGGEVNLHKYCKMITVDLALETVFNEGEPLQQPRYPDDSKPLRKTRLDAKLLGQLLALCVDLAIKDQDLEEWDLDDVDVVSLQHYLNCLVDYLDNRVFVELLREKPETAIYWFHDAVIGQPYIYNEDGDLLLVDDDED